MIPFYVFDAGSGRIVRWGQTQEVLLPAMVQAGDEEVREGAADGLTQFVDVNTGTLLDKSVLTLTPSIDDPTPGDVTIADVPLGSKITVDVFYLGQNSETSIEINLWSGSWRVRIDAARFLLWDQIIVVP